MQSINKIVYLVLALVAISFNGCSQSGPSDFSPVSGTITIDGEPLAGAKVVFIPVKFRDADRDKLPYSYATTDKDGRYKLRSDDGNRGAAVGQHMVFISTAEAFVPKGPGDPRLKNLAQSEGPKSGSRSSDPRTDRTDSSKTSQEKADSQRDPEPGKTPPTDRQKSGQIASPDSDKSGQGNLLFAEQDSPDSSRNPPSQRVVVKEETILSEYNSNSKLEFRVKAGTSNQANFDLSRFPN